MKTPLFHQIAVKCLNKYWNSCATDMYGGGWDKGSPAHSFALRWSKQNINRFRHLSFGQIYTEYKRCLVQE